jgi:putative SOS response-associated peptidase YedK
MCGRYTLTLTPDELKDLFPDVTFNIEHSPRFNIAPSQLIPVIRRDGNGNLRADMLKWGLIPSWSKDERIGFRLINARAETVAEKPAFREAFKSRRCLIPATGYFEWIINAETKNKLPIYFIPKSNDIFTFAGLWETWISPDGKIIESTTIITTEPNSFVNNYHLRMPAILPGEEHDKWLSPAVKSLDEYSRLLKSYPNEMDCFPVSMMVNNIKNDSPDIIVPL